MIDAPNPDLKLKPGLTANITVMIHEKEDVLMLPLRALRFQPEDELGDTKISGEVKVQPGVKESKSVWIQTAEGLTNKNIRTGISDGIYTEVLEGVKAGERVIIGVQLPEKDSKPAKKGKPGGNPLMPNMTGERPQH